MHAPVARVAATDRYRCGLARGEYVEVGGCSAPGRGLVVVELESNRSPGLAPTLGLARLGWFVLRDVDDNSNGMASFTRSEWGRTAGNPSGGGRFVAQPASGSCEDARRWAASEGARTPNPCGGQQYGAHRPARQRFDLGRRRWKRWRAPSTSSSASQARGLREGGKIGMP